MTSLLLQSGLGRIKGFGLWPLWTVGYWAMVWLMVLGHLASTTETLCFIGSWPFYAALLSPTGAFDVVFFCCVPVFIWLFVVYWQWLLRFVTHNTPSLLAGCVVHLLGGVGWVCMYNQSHYGIPFRFYFWDTIAGGAVTAGYILGYGAIHWYFVRRMIHTTET